MTIKFGIPTLGNNVKDEFPGRAVLTLHKLETEKSKRRFSLSKTAAEQFGIQPGYSKVAFSFEDDKFMIGVIPEEQAGIPAADRYLVNKELGFTNKRAYEYVCKQYTLSTNVDNNIEFTSIEDSYGFRLGTLSNRLMNLPEPHNTSESSPEEAVTSTNVESNDSVL